MNEDMQNAEGYRRDLAILVNDTTELQVTEDMLTDLLIELATDYNLTVVDVEADYSALLTAYAAAEDDS